MTDELPEPSGTLPIKHAGKADVNGELYDVFLVGKAVEVDLDSTIREAHERLDRAGVPRADGLTCDDPACDTKLGHRIKLLISERDELRRRLA